MEYKIQTFQDKDKNNLYMVMLSSCRVVENELDSDVVSHIRKFGGDMHHAFTDMNKAKTYLKGLMCESKKDKETVSMAQ